jgi:hypothetical protein
MSDAPETIWLSVQPDYWENNIGTVFTLKNGSHEIEYRRADLPPTTAQIMALNARQLAVALRPLLDDDLAEALDQIMGIYETGGYDREEAWAYADELVKISCKIEAEFDR